jgi:hypothetical protein
LSAGFGGLVWFCCGLTGVLGFWSPEPELGALLIGISFSSILEKYFSGTTLIWRLRGRIQGRAHLLFVELFSLSASPFSLSA